MKDQAEELNGSTFDRNMDAAVILGLFEKDEEGNYTPTKRGKKIGYGLTDGEERTIFRDVIRESEFYKRLLNIMSDKLTEKNGEQYLSRDDVMKEIGINFDFGVGDRTLESASGTFLRVMDAAGLGTYTRGHNNYPTRLVVNDEYTDFLKTIREDEMNEENDNEETAEKDKPENEESEHTLLSQSGNEKPEQDLNSESPHTSEGQNHEETHEEEIVIKEALGRSMKVHINVDVSSSDRECDEVLELIEVLQSD